MTRDRYQHLPAHATIFVCQFSDLAAEYLVIAVYLVFSIFLRQQDSAESKPPEADNRSTGEHND